MIRRHAAVDLPHACGKKGGMVPDDPLLRQGEIPFPVDDAAGDDAALRFIGRIRSPWTARAGCPKSLREARERGGGGMIEVAPRYRLALGGLGTGQWILVLSWLHRARRDLAVQSPRHSPEPRGTFSLRSPVRPNPIGLHLVRITAIDIHAGRIAIDAIDVLDDTPLLDVKPFVAGVDTPPPDAE